uniref:Uncharacterized protein n=1 Tax=Mycobacterium sp. (strain JLS) TaxID=164757 RepID=A0A5Q5CB03_MYCSJ
MPGDAGAQPSTHLVLIRPSGIVTRGSLCHLPERAAPGTAGFPPTTNRVYPLVNATGTVLVTDVIGTGAPGDPLSTILTLCRPGEMPVVVEIPGPPVGKGLGADGTVTYAASTASGSTFTVLRPGQPAVTISTPGLVSNGPVVGPDGTLYQVTDDRVSGRTNLTIVTAAGEVTRLDFAGSSPSLAIDPDGGKVVLVMTTREGGIETRTGYEIAVVTGAASSV